MVKSIKKVQVGVRIWSDVLKFIDDIARLERSTRGEVIRNILLEWVNEHNTKAMKERIKKLDNFEDNFKELTNDK